MSTDYHRPQYPITNLELTEGADYNVLTIYVNDGLSGVLNLPKLVTWMFIQMLIGDEGVAMHTWGSKDKGVAVEGFGPCLPDNILVISDGGGLFTVGQVRALAGKGKRE